MASSLLIAAAPLTALLLLLWSFDRQVGRSGALLVGSVLWGGIPATILVTLASSAWVEQPGWYPYLVTPVVEELAKAALFVILIWRRLIPGVAAGLAYGLACGLGFALWENAAYFEQGLTLWLYLTRTVGTALLHAGSTGVLGAACGLAVQRERRWVRALALASALTVAIIAHGSWNYVCLVLSDDSPLRRVMPAIGLTLLAALLVWSMFRQRWDLRREILSLWQEGAVNERVAKAMMTWWPTRALRRAGIRRPGKLARVLGELALARLEQRQLVASQERARAKHAEAVDRLDATVRALLDPESPMPRARPLGGRVMLAGGLAVATLALHLLGQISPVPAALARRTIVITSGAAVRPEPLITVMGRESYVLWQRGPAKNQREQMLTWLSPSGEQRHRSLGELPAKEPDWFDMGNLGDRVAVATRHGDDVWLRTFQREQQVGEIRFAAPEAGPEPCWPWLASDRGRLLVGWDRLRHATWITKAPLSAGADVMDLPDPFPDVDTPEEACIRGFTLTDETAYVTVRPSGQARVAAVDLESLQHRLLDICPGESTLRVHSFDKDQGQVLVLLGAKGVDASYRLLLARLDRDGNVISRCRDLRSMPAGEPYVIDLAAAGDTAFLAWSTRSHILLARLALAEEDSVRQSWRWVLDRAPSDGYGVVRVSVVNERLYVTWEGHSPDGRWSLKLLRTEVDDLP